MRITLLGATGSVGAHVVEQAPADGHEIVALVRDPARLPARPGLTVVRGDATVPADVTAAVDGSDAVIVALGAGRAAGVRETGTRTAVEAMRATGVRRLVCLSTLGAGESRANLNFVWKYLMFGLLLRAAYADHQRQEEVVRGSGLDWTLIRPSAYTDGPRTGDYRHGFGPDATGLTLKVARADVADALLRAVTDRAPGRPCGGGVALSTLTDVDVLEALLDGPRARGAFLLRSLLDPPWALRIEDGAPLTVAAPLRGEAWLLPDDGDAVRLSTGDVAIVRGPGFYTVADDPATEPSVVVLPGGLCTSAEDGRSLVDEWSLGVRTWGAPEGRTTLLTGTYDNAGEASKPLLAALPALVVLRRDQWRSPLIDVLAEEMQIAAPGQRAVLDRLLDVLLISALRTWFAAQREHAPAWYRAQQDPVVGVALARIHGAPERPWTVATLAAEAGVSRANLAKRFTDLLGEPPMAYLTHWRLAVAADLLTDPEATVTSVARRVGYSTPFAFSTAFKRARGISPQQHRLRGATA